MLFSVRRLIANSADAATAKRVAAEFSGNDVTVGHTEQFLTNSSNYLIVAESGDSIAGFLSAHKLTRFKDARQKMFIYEVDVAPQRQRHGVGRRLVESILGIARDEGVDTAFVFTDQRNAAARALYTVTGGVAVNGDDLMFEYDLRAT